MCYHDGLLAQQDRINGDCVSIFARCSLLHNTGCAQMNTDDTRLNGFTEQIIGCAFTVVSRDMERS